MKKLLLFMGIAAMIFSCKPSVNVKSQTGLKGNWEVTDVQYVNASGLKIEVFDLADAMCFDGSTWNFVSNNNRGSFSIMEDGTCKAGTYAISWFVSPQNEFKFKYIDGVKAKTVTEGYSLNLINQTENSFQLEQNIPFEGKFIQVIYSFTRK